MLHSFADSLKFGYIENCCAAMLNMTPTKGEPKLDDSTNFNRQFDESLLFVVILRTIRANAFINLATDYGLAGTELRLSLAPSARTGEPGLASYFGPKNRLTCPGGQCQGKPRLRSSKPTICGKIYKCVRPIPIQALFWKM